MYAVIKSGGKQYRVAQGDTLRLETLGGSAGDAIEFDIDGGKVTATIKSHGRGRKVGIVKFRRRKHHMKRMGHRQNYTEVEITGITG